MTKFLFLVCVGLICLCVFSASAYSLGVSRPYLDDNTISLDINETGRIEFSIQNEENTTKSVMLTFETQVPMKFNGGNNSYSVSSVMNASSSFSVPLNFSSTEDGLYRVKYKLSEAAGSGSGISFSFSSSDYFYIRVGTGNFSKSIGIPLVYPGYTFVTNSDNASKIEDLIIQAGRVEVDFRGKTLDLRGFNGSYIKFTDKSVFINSSAMPTFNQKAKIVFYNIKSEYKIYRDGVECSYPACKVLSYQSRKLTVEVSGFSKYEIVDSDPPEKKTETKTSSSGGTIPPRNYTTPRNQTSQANSTVKSDPVPVVNPPVVNPPVVTQPPPTPPANSGQEPQIINNQQPPQQIVPTVSQEAKDLLSTMLILQFILLVLMGSLLFYYYRNMEVLT
jgi:hypothetical protein